MTRSLRAALLAAAMMGCAASSPSPAPSSSHQPNFTTDGGFASADECGQVADHLFTIALHGTSKHVTEEHLAGGSNVEYRGRYNRFVASCTTKLTHKDAACVLDAPAFQYVEQCELLEGTPVNLGGFLPTRPSSPAIPGDF